MSRDSAARSLNAPTEITLVPSRRISVIKQNRLGGTTLIYLFIFFFLMRPQKRFSMKLEGSAV